MTSVLWFLCSQWELGKCKAPVFVCIMLRQFRAGLKVREHAKGRLVMGFASGYPEIGYPQTSCRLVICLTTNNNLACYYLYYYFIVVTNALCLMIVSM